MKLFDHWTQVLATILLIIITIVYFIWGLPLIAKYF